jgi:thioredoxin 1
LSDVVEVNSKQEFDKILATEDEVVLKFWATWCGPCRQLAPHYETLAEKASGLKFVEVDVDKVPDLAVEYGVLGVPTVKLFRGGEFASDLKGRTVVSLLKEIADN